MQIHRKIRANQKWGKGNTNRVMNQISFVYFAISSTNTGRWSEAISSGITRRPTTE
jgi:hypothetical protein